MPCKKLHDLKILGSIRKNTELIISERHLGLVPANEKNLAEDKISYLAKTISNSLDIKNFKDIGLKIEKQNKIKSEEKLKQCKYKKKYKDRNFHKDKSFGFYYHDDLENFKKLGVDLVPINSIKGKILPKIDGLFIGGGFPEIYAKQIEKNKSLINSVRKFINDGFPVYAECRLMYLTKSIKHNKKEFKMAGVLPAKTIMNKRPVGRGYVKVQSLKNHPWGFKK